MTTAEILATWRTKAHGILYRFERSVEELRDFPGDAAAKRKVAYQWEIAMSRNILELQRQAEEYQDDEIMESIELARNRAKCFRCDIPLGRGL